MRVEQKILDRFILLIDEGKALMTTLKFSEEELSLHGPYAFGYLDRSLSVRWKVRCVHFLEQLCGTHHHYCKTFEAFSKSHGTGWANDALIILETARDDYKLGHLIEFRVLVEAKVFQEFLEQADYLLSRNYCGAAAVIAGCVLEDGLRKLCLRNSIMLSSKATIEPMNVELAKIGIYNKFVQKKITALADLRNKAAHGEWTEFTEKDVEDMIRDVRRFMEDYFS
jgi:hypothetical protein